MTSFDGQFGTNCVCLWHHLQFTQLLAAFCVPSVVNHLSLPMSSGECRGMQTRTLKRGDAGDGRGSRCQGPELLLPNAGQPELWDHVFVFT